MQTTVKNIRIETVGNYQTVCGSQNEAFCLFCRQQVGLICGEQAAIYFQADLYAIDRLVQTGEVHRLHNSQGEIMICGKSLQDAKNKLGAPQFLNIKPTYSDK